MSTQEGSDIDFSILPEAQQQHFRLLELPSELFELLLTDDAPTQVDLKIISTANTSGQTSEQNAVLCTPDNTFNVRQVNTSNSLFVTQPSSGTRNEIPQPRIDAIAQSHFTLELQPASDVSAATHIKTRLPVYASTGHYQSKDPLTKESLFRNVPASGFECENAWRDLGCFELDGEALIPSASVKVGVWRSILTVAAADGIDLTAPLKEQQLPTLVDLNDNQYPREISSALLRSMAEGGSGGALTLDEKKCARAVGRSLLRDRADATPLPKAVFGASWADLLPEKWRGSAELSLLEGSYRLEDGGILFNDGDSKTANIPALGAKAPAEAKSALGAKRKWHEKFRATKKTA